MKVLLVGGPRDGWGYEMHSNVEVIEVAGIDYEPGVPLREQRVVTETGVYARADETTNGFRFEWRGWRGVPAERQDRIRTEIPDIAFERADEPVSGQVSGQNGPEPEIRA